MAIYLVNLSLSFILLLNNTKSIILSFIGSFILFIFLYAFRVFEEESLENINEQFSNVGISVIFSTAFIIVINEIFFEVCRAEDILFSSIVFFVTVSFTNVLVFKIYSLKTNKPESYLVIGKESDIGQILDEIKEKTKGKYLFVEYINPSPKVLEKKVVSYDNILVGNYELYKEVKDMVNRYKEEKKVKFLPDLAEKILKRIPLEVVKEFEEYYELEFRSVKESPAKRILDIIGALIGLIVYSPLILIFGICILIEDGLPVVFKQMRVGKGGKEFLLYKLRSMRNKRDGKAKFADDEKERILKIGKFIRKTRIDESLQFYNILKGEMSLVGPRPEQVPFARDFEQRIPYYTYRYKVKPGLTGWAQIMYRYSSNLEETKKKLEYDLYYIKNRNIFLDISILLQTLETIFWRRGAK